MKHTALVALATLIMACGGMSDTHINKDINVPDGAHAKGSFRSVNGSVTVGNEAIVEGSCTTVNGAIAIGENSEVGELSCVNGSISVDRNSTAREIACVNGSISLGAEAKIDGDVSTVNGEIRCKSFVNIAGDLETVNGDIKVTETRIVGNVGTVNGDVTLLEKSIVDGDIIIDRDHKKPNNKEYKKLVITIDGKSKVKGNIEVRGDEPNVMVILAGGGEVLGEIINAEVVRK
ncbi:MAG: hypothetical protein K9M55_03945 [Candidatus Marinimicrobia bacterium]|nr:hypothetical protein [Candidatus Neomarinimicrobiota bacterium]MCF7921832.1 hypothetical protein [Candidatus Neomarinimicrobiota bacterium]